MDVDLLAETSRAAHSAVADPEIDAVELAVDGELPREISGTLLTVGPNTDELAGWGMGPGLLHALLVDHGALTLRSRSLVPASADPADTVDARASLRAGRGNSSLVTHAGRLLALHEVGLPLEVGDDLRTVGLFDFDGRLTTAMCSHPKVDRQSGELMFFGCALAPPFVTYHVAGPDGALHTSVSIDWPGPTAMHDFAVSERWAVFIDQPNVVSLLGLLQGDVTYVWDPGHRARLGLLARQRPHDPVQWLDIPARDVTHVLNAFDDGDVVVMDVVARTPSPDDPARLDLFPTLRRWRIDPRTGSFDERSLSAAGVENPKIDDRRATRRHRWAYAIEMGGEPGGPGNFMTTVGWLAVDTESGAIRRHHLGAGFQLGQAVFVPRPDGAGDDDGWIAGLVYDHRAGQTELRLVDVTRLDGPPVARARLPRHVPATLDCIWVPGGAATSRG